MPAIKVCAPPFCRVGTAHHRALSRIVNGGQCPPYPHGHLNPSIPADYGTAFNFTAANLVKAVP